MKKAKSENKTILEIVEQDGLMTAAEMKSIFSAQKLTKPGVPKQ